MSEDALEEALRYIGDSLTQPQRRALVRSLVLCGQGTRVRLIGADENTVRALKRGYSPLVDQDGTERFLTPLGVAVARVINKSPE